MPFKIIRNDITKVRADALVNTANPCPVVGGGTDSAIYNAAGKTQLLEKRKQIGDIAAGCAEYTPAFALDAKYIIHTVGPAWIDGNSGETEILHLCYRNSLELAAKLSCESIAFPLIATGVYGFPKDKALQIALYEINAFLLTHEMEVIIVVFDKMAFELSERLVGKIDEYIDEHGVGIAKEAEYGSRKAEVESRARRLFNMPFTTAKTAEKKENDHAAASITADFANVEGKSLDELLNDAGESFGGYLLKLIDESGMDDVAVYKKANIDRKVFSRIRCNANYKPKKTTAVAFAIALELDMPTARELLSRAGMAFSPSSKFDLIITYFITNGVYDIFEINAALFKYGQPMLGVEN